MLGRCRRTEEVGAGGGEGATQGSPPSSSPPVLPPTPCLDSGLLSLAPPARRDTGEGGRKPAWLPSGPGGEWEVGMERAGQSRPKWAGAEQSRPEQELARAGQSGSGGGAGQS